MPSLAVCVSSMPSMPVGDLRVVEGGGSTYLRGIALILPRPVETAPSSGRYDSRVE